jgi:hypothetical protein
LSVFFTFIYKQLLVLDLYAIKTTGYEVGLFFARPSLNGNTLYMNTSREINLNLIKKIALVIALSVSTLANAGLLTEDDYITVNHGDINAPIYLDWAWVSDFNVQFYIEKGEFFNELYAPTHVPDRWREATPEEFSYFSDNVTAVDFKRETGGFKNAVKYFNSNELLSISDTEFKLGQISGTVRTGTTFDDSSFFGQPENSWYDTFYVRESSAAVAPGPTPIPEPWSILIFATGLLALQSKLRKK